MSELRIVIMAGGRGERMNRVEKALLKLRERPLIEYVVDVARRLGGELYVAPSRHTPLTERWCLEKHIPVIRTEGEGYSKDLMYIASKLDRPILFLPADTPFITPELLARFLEEAMKAREDLVTLVVDRSNFPEELRRGPIRSPVGVSLLKGDGWGWRDVVMRDFPELLDIDGWLEFRLGEALLG
ncbi:MAG: NTP transferase domain-containing protein [Thaumarchaeota archaeon]|nr:NTP transferase domain-containing protein [Nitrososphaerota archaeon]